MYLLHSLRHATQKVVGKQITVKSLSQMIPPEQQATTGFLNRAKSLLKYMTDMTDFLVLPCLQIAN